MTVNVNGLPFSDAGRLRVKGSAPTTVSSGGIGIVHTGDDPDGVPYVAYQALGGTAVDAAAVTLGAFTFVDDRLQTTTETAAGDTFRDGLRFRADGALVVQAADGAFFLGPWGRMANGAATIEVAPA